MTVFDSGAIVSGLVGDAAMADVDRLLRDPDSAPSVSAISIAEIMDVLVRVRGQRVDACDDRLELLFAGGLDVIPVDGEIARLGGLLRARHWDRDRRAVSMADCLVLATAILRHEQLATADRALAAAARAEGHAVVVLPDSSGSVQG